MKNKRINVLNMALFALMAVASSGVYAGSEPVVVTTLPTTCLSTGETGVGTGHYDTCANPITFGTDTTTFYCKTTEPTAATAGTPTTTWEATTDGLKATSSISGSAVTTYSKLLCQAATATTADTTLATGTPVVTTAMDDCQVSAVDSTGKCLGSTFTSTNTDPITKVVTTDSYCVTSSGTPATCSVCKIKTTTPAVAVAAG